MVTYILCTCISVWRFVGDNNHLDISSLMQFNLLWWRKTRIDFREKTLRIYWEFLEQDIPWTNDTYLIIHGPLGVVQYMSYQNDIETNIKEIRFSCLNVRFVQRTHAQYFLYSEAMNDRLFYKTLKGPWSWSLMRLSKEGSVFLQRIHSEYVIKPSRHMNDATNSRL